MSKPRPTTEHFRVYSNAVNLVARKCRIPPERDARDFTLTTVTAATLEVRYAAAVELRKLEAVCLQTVVCGIIYTNRNTLSANNVGIRIYRLPHSS